MRSHLISNTQVDFVKQGHRTIMVKREDLCSPYPGPSFSKIRGVLAHIASRPESVIGVLDTYHSKAGWAVAYCCQLLGKRCINFYPRYKEDGLTLRKQQQMAEALGAWLEDLPAGRSAILYHQAKKCLAEDHEDSYMMPNALKLPETVSETAAEVWRTLDANPSLPALVKNVVISVSSGTIAAGVLRGFATHYRYKDDLPLPWFVLHAGYSRSEDAVRDYIWKTGGPEVLECLKRSVFVDEGYAYKDAYKPRTEAQQAPFPCNPYYDAKAWGWLNSELTPGASPRLVGKMMTDVLFWNVGE